MSTFFAQPYNLDAVGFYFDTLELFTARSEKLTDSLGYPVEEFEIQFIDGDDVGLFSACNVSQANLNVWFESIEDLSGSEKIALFYLCGVSGYAVDNALDKLDEVSLYEGRLQDAAEEMFDEIYLDSVPEAIRAYIDYEKFARDCDQGGDLVEFQCNGTTWTCTNASCL